MKIMIAITLFMVSLLSKGQNNTIIYLSNLGRVMTSRENAAFCYELKKEKRGDQFNKIRELPGMLIRITN